MKKNFLKNKTGAISVIGVLALSLSFSAIGGVIDYSLMLKRKGDLQDSLDTAVTLVVSHYAMLLSEKKNMDGMLVFAQEHFNMNFRPTSNENVLFTIKFPNNEDPMIRFEASLNYTPLFLNVFHSVVSAKIQKEYTLKAVAEAHLSNFIEAALVLDVSGPIAHSFDSGDGVKSLKKAAMHFINTMTEKGRSYLKVALVPFDTFVNVGSQYTPSPQRPYYWMDPYTKSPKHWAHFDFLLDKNNHMIMHPTEPHRMLSLKKDSSFNIFVREGDGWSEEERGKIFNRFDLLASMQHFDSNKNYSMRWKGCVEAPLYPYNVSDSYDPNKAESFFIPTFYPDHAIDVSKNRITNYWPDTPYLHSVTPSFYRRLSSEARKNYSFYYPSGNPNYASLNSFGLIFNDVRKYFIKHDLSSYKLLSKTGTYFLDLKRQKEVGPNLFCNDFPLVLLKKPFLMDDFKLLEKAIDKLEYTYAHANLTEGLVWGWRVLSSGHPFTQGVPYSKKSMQKMIILISDGVNEFFSIRNEFLSVVDDHHTQYFSIYQRLYKHQKLYKNQRILEHLNYNAYGYGDYATQQMSDSFVKRVNEGRPMFHKGRYMVSYNHEMDNQTYEACEKIKQQGITIIVVGLGVKRNSNAEELMKACASSLSNRIKQKKGKLKKMYWYADEASLKDIFLEISQIIVPFRFVE